MPIEDLNRVAKAQAEFKDFLSLLHKVGGTNLSKEDKRTIFRAMLCDMSEETYTQNFPDILEMVQSSKTNCEPFEDSETQVEDIMAWLPRLEDHRELVLLIIKERRKSYKLKV